MENKNRIAARILAFEAGNSAKIENEMLRESICIGNIKSN